MSNTVGTENMKDRIIEGFGSRLADIRKSRSLTQAQIGEMVGVSNRVIAYYETESDQPPGALLADLAKALKVSADELLGLKPPKEESNPKLARLLNRLKRVADLPPADQRAVLQHIDALVDSRCKTKPAKRVAS